MKSFRGENFYSIVASCFTDCFSGSSNRMSSVDIRTAGNLARSNIRTKLPDEDALRTALRSQDFDGSLQSCAATASVLGDVIANGQNNPCQIRGLSPQAIAGKISDLLSRGMMVAISLLPDHHFIVIPVDDDHVCLYQAFQDAYSLHDWIKADQNSTEGSRSKNVFVSQIVDLVSEDEQTRMSAARYLFSFDGQHHHIDRWSRNRIQINAVVYKSII
jgi:hypothetical protein